MNRNGAGAYLLAATAIIALWVQSARLGAVQDEMGRRERSDQANAYDLRVARWEKESLIEAVNRLAGTGPAVRGLYNDSMPSPATLDTLGDRLVYVISTRCGNCPLNFPWLALLERRRPGSVLGVSVVDSVSTLVQYGRHHELPFPIVSLRGGWLFDALPRHATPVTVVVREGRITRIATGALTDAAARDVMAQLLPPLTATATVMQQ